MENEPFEDVFPIENGDFPLLCLITGVFSWTNDGSAYLPPTCSTMLLPVPHPRLTPPIALHTWDRIQGGGYDSYQGFGDHEGGVIEDDTVDG